MVVAKFFSRGIILSFFTAVFLFVMLCLRAHLSFEPRSESFLIFANSLEDCFQTEDTLILQGVKYAFFPRMSVSFIFVAI